MFRWSTLWLIHHVTSFLAAFGPGFLYPFLGVRVAKEPQHGLFVAETLEG